MSKPPTLAGLNISAARRALATYLASTGIQSAEIDARILTGHVADLSLTQLVTEGHRSLGGSEAIRLEQLAKRRSSGEPIARIVGEQEFWGLRLALSPETLIPRADTETLVEASLEILRRIKANDGSYRIADLGTGTGAILLALLHELPRANGIGTDLSEDALRTARANAVRHGLADRASFAASDYASALTGAFDLIVSNPPYIPSVQIGTLAIEVRDHDPRLALDGGTDGLDAYRKIASQVPPLLKPGSVLAVEVGAGQADNVEEIMRAAGLASTGPAKPDLAGIPRVVLGRKPSV